MLWSRSSADRKWNIEVIRILNRKHLRWSFVHWYFQYLFRTLTSDFVHTSSQTSLNDAGIEFIASAIAQHSHSLENLYLNISYIDFSTNAINLFWFYVVINLFLKQATLLSERSEHNTYLTQSSLVLACQYSLWC